MKNNSPKVVRNSSLLTSKRKEFPIMFLLVFLINTLPANAQEVRTYELKQMPLEIFKDASRLTFSPIKFRTKEWLYTAGVGAILAVTITQDSEIRNAVQDNTGNFSDGLATYVGEPLGNLLYVLPALAITYTGAHYGNNLELKGAAYMGVKATVIGGIAALSLKSLFQRRRPDAGTAANSEFWLGPFPIRNDDFHSFPSGHTTVAFALATSISEYYKDDIWVALTLYPLATITAWSRVYDDRHWASDVVAGAALGVLIGKIVNQPNRFKWGVVPNQFNGTNVSLEYQF